MSEVMNMPVWDMSLWEPCADQDYLMLSYESNYTAGRGWNFNYSCPGLDQSSYYDEDHGQCDFAFRYTYDIIEEDALNEKCCIQVLKVLIHKADADILKLEEDILMLECQLAWDNEEVSEPCSVALNKGIDHLDDLIRSFKNEFNYVHDVSAELEEPGKVIHRLHDLVKPLLENYILVKSEKTRRSNMVVPSLSSDVTSNKTMETNISELSMKVGAKKQVNQRKKDLSMEPKERKNNLAKRRPIPEKAAVTDTEEKKTLSDLKSEGYQRTAENTCTPFFKPVKKAKTVTHKKGEDIISKIFKNAHQYAKEMAKLNKQMGKEVPKSAPTKFEKRSIITSEEPSISIVKQDTNPSRTKKSDSRSDLTGNIEPSISIVKQDTNPSRTKKSDSRRSGLRGNNEVLSTAEPQRLQFVHEINITDSYLKSQEKVGEVVQPSISILKQDTNRSRTKKSDSRGSGLTGNNEVLSTAEPHRVQLVLEMKTTNSYLKLQEKVGAVQLASVIFEEQTSEEITKTRETRAYRHAINKDWFGKKPLVKKRKRASFPERTDALESREPETVDFDDSISLSELFELKRKKPRKAREQTKDKNQGQQIAKNLVIKLDNPDYYVKPDQGPGNPYVRKQEIAPVTCIPEETLQGLSWTEKGDASQVIHTLVSS